MKHPSPSISFPDTCPAFLAPLAFLAFAILVVLITLHTDRAARSFSACAVPPDTIQGIPEPRFFLENDSYVWLSHTRDLLNSGGWRLRHTYMDNAPYGRPMHWSHLLIWCILLSAKAIMGITHWPAPLAIELIGVWIMPAWHIIFLALLFYALPRRIGFLPTALFALLSISNQCIASATFPLKPDHHVFQLAFGISVFLCLQWAASWRLPSTRSASLPPHRLPLFRFPLPPSPSEALRAATAAGIFLGLLYWIGATVAFFVLALSAISLLPLLPCFHAPVPSPLPRPPALWRRFAISAIAVAAACWLLEYAPTHFSMRLEVNHPLHWLPILGVSLGLSTLSTLPRHPRPADFLSHRLLLSAALCLSLPLAIAFGPVSWYLLKDPLLQRLHQTHIVEFLPITPTPLDLLSSYRLPALALVATPLVLLCKRYPLPARARPVLFSSLLFVLFFLAATTWQRRWGYLFSAALYALAILLSLAILETRPRRFPFLPATVVLLAAFLSLADAIYAFHCRRLLENRIAAAAVPTALHNDMYKRMALRLGAQMGTNRWIIAGTPSEAPAFYYFASIPALASFYWENLDGWRAETALMDDASPGFSNALAVARERGVTHFLRNSPSDTPQLFHHLATGSSAPAAALSQTFCGHLFHPNLFSRLPLVLLDDPALNAAVTAPVLVRTPFGEGDMSAQLHIFTLAGYTPNDIPALHSGQPPASPGLTP